MATAIREYSLELVNAEMWEILDVNNMDEVLIERQLIPQASPVPLLVQKNGKETSPLECPGTVNDTTAEGLNNRGDIVGHCGHDSSAPGLFAFVASPKTGEFTLLAYPGAQTTWGYDINDVGQVVGFYANPIEPPFCCFLPPRHLHSFLWDKTTDSYYTIDNPLAADVGGWTWLHGINNKGQVVGHYNTLKNVPWEEYQFIYENGVFTPIAVPGADQTHITGLNNKSQILGWYSAQGCNYACVFLFDSAQYSTVNLPLPANAPRPDGTSGGIAPLTYLGGLNDKEQFVGTYIRTAEWMLDIFGGWSPSRVEIRHFVASPKHGTENFDE